VGSGTFWSNRISHSDSFRTFKSCDGEDHVSHAYTLRKISKTRVRVYTSYGTGNIVKLLSANDVTVFKILTFWTYWEKAKLKFSQLETAEKNLRVGGV
jgi:hypothetical protein